MPFFIEWVMHELVSSKLLQVACYMCAYSYISIDFNEVIGYSWENGSIIGKWPFKKGS